jgi:hypothetical protein
MLEVIESSLKRRWHDELVARPETHAWVLNLYRAGEEHPEHVDDYFPVDHAPAGLREKLALHREQERMHARLYASAVEQLAQPLEEFRGLDVFNVAIRAHTAASFRIGDDDDHDVKCAKLAHFLAHAHFLEARIARSLELHLDACERAKSSAAKAVAIVLRDEREHASYTKAAVFDLVPRATALAILAVHRVGEAAANRAFSARQVRSHLARHATTTSMPAVRRATWAMCAIAMELAGSGARASDDAAKEVAWSTS